MNLRLIIIAWNSRLLVWCTIVVNASINSFCISNSLLLGSTYLQFKWFSPILQYLHDVRLEITTFGLSRSSPKRDKIVGQIESRLTEVYCMFTHHQHNNVYHQLIFRHRCSCLTSAWCKPQINSCTVICHVTCFSALTTLVICFFFVAQLFFVHCIVANGARARIVKLCGNVFEKLSHFQTDGLFVVAGLSKFMPDFQSFFGEMLKRVLWLKMR